MPVLSIFCRFAFRVTGASSVSASGSLSALSSRTCVGRWSCCDRGSASRFRLPPRLWSTVRRVVVRNRVILGCDVTRCLCRLAPGASSVLVRFFRGPRCHCLVIASQCLVACLSSRMCHCCCLSLSSVFGVSVSSLAVAGLVSCVGRAIPSIVRGLRCDRIPLPVGSWSVWGFSGAVRVWLRRGVVAWSWCVCESAWKGRFLKSFHLSLNFRSAALLRSCRVIAVRVACFRNVAHLFIFLCRHAPISLRLNFSAVPHFGGARFR